MNLRVITTQRHRCRHNTYTAICPKCVEDRASRRAAVCECDRPTIFADPTADGEPTCLRCGRPSGDPSLYPLPVAA